MARRCGGVIEVQKFDAKKRVLALRISDAGLCGSKPHVTEFEIKWRFNGDAPYLKGLRVNLVSERDWTTQDRIDHKAGVAKAKTSRAQTKR